MKRIYHFLVTSYKLRVTRFKRFTSHRLPHTSYLIPLFAFCFLHFSAEAQNSFPTSNAIWNESIYKNGVKHEYLYGLLGDTIINDMLYSRLFEFSDTLLLVDNIRGYIGALRNEEQKVFFKPINWEYPDILLYDFGAEVGDTVWHNAGIFLDYNNIEPNNSYSVINSIIIDENNRKNYEIDCSGNLPWVYNYWIEGVGSYRGLLRSMGTSLPLDGNSYDYELNCFKQDDTVKYVNSSCNKCFCRWLVNILDYEIALNYINVFPNPTNYELRITNYELRMGDVEIFDVMGRMQKAECRKQNTEDEMVINISHLQSGIYFLKIDNQTIKIIKN